MNLMLAKNIWYPPKSHDILFFFLLFFIGGEFTQMKQKFNYIPNHFTCNFHNLKEEICERIIQAIVFMVLKNTNIMFRFVLVMLIARSLRYHDMQMTINNNNCH